MARLFVVPALILALAASSVAAAQDAPAAPAPPLQKSIDQLTVPELLTAAQSLRSAGKIPEAQSLVARALAKEEKSVEAHNLAGDLYLVQQPRPDIIAAQKEFTIVRQLQPSDFQANFGLGKIFAHSRVWRQARFYFLEAERVCPADRMVELSIALAEAHRNSGIMKDALEAVRKAIDTDPTSLEARQMYVALLVDTGVLDKALTENDETLTLAKQQVQNATNNKLTALQQLYRAYDSRVAILQQTVGRFFAPLADGKRSDRIFPGKEAEASAALKNLTDVFILQAELRLTLSYFDTVAYAERAAFFNPTDADAWLRCARLYRNTAQLEHAADRYQKVLAIEPNNEEARRELEALGVLPAVRPPPTEPASAPAIP